MTNKPTFGTLFSGGGIADCGFIAAGMEPRWAVEMEPAIADVYRANFANHPCFTSRVEDIDWRRMEPIDHGHASPSCKNASRANTNGRECEGDLSAARAVCSFIDIIRPATFSLENVWGYRTFQSFRMILECLEDRGYFVHYQHLNSADFGVPQTRERLILRACLDDLVPSLPAPVRWVGWYEAIEDLLDTLPESEFAPWQLARLPQDLGDFLIGGGNTNKTMIDSAASRAIDPAFTVAATNALRNNRAFLVDHRNASRGTTVRFDDQPSITIDTGVMRRPSSTPSAFLVSGTDANVRGCDSHAGTITAAQGKGTIAHRAFIVHGQDQRTMPVRQDGEHRLTVLANGNGNSNVPRAFIVDGQANGNGETLTCRQGEEWFFTLAASSAKRPARAWLECGRVVKMNVRALARFQSVPGWYKFPDRANLACTIIGGGFPSLMAQRIAEGLYGSESA